MPCGSAELGGHFRLACTLPCCIVPVKPESDEEWAGPAYPPYWDSIDRG